MKLGVLLLNLGGASSLDEVEPFLVELFSDPDIIQIPLPVPFSRWLQKPLARFIAKKRKKLSQSYYRAIGGGSPLLEITQRQARALEEILRRRFATPQDDIVKVYVGMRYSKPSILDAWNAAKGDGCETIVALPLYPQYSVATTSSSFKEVASHVAEKNGAQPSSRGPNLTDPRDLKLHYIQDWYSHPLYIEAMTNKINASLNRLPIQFQNNFHLIFSAHSLPLKMIQSGDPYERQIKETVQLILNKLPNIKSWHLSYQSKAGPMKWLEPSTWDLMKDLAARNRNETHKRALVMVPISFVSDHVETLYEMDIYYKKHSEQLGFPYFCRSESLNTDPLFISALGDVVTKCLLGTEKR